MAEMKDSGIEWVGKIPNNWEADKIKYHLRRNEPRNPGGKEVLSVYRDYGVIPKDSRDDNHNVTSEDTSKYKYVKKGNLVINKMKAWQGSLAISYYEGIVSPAYFIYEFIDDKFENKYFHYLIRSCYKDEFRRLSGGIREGQWDLSASEFEKTLILIPSIPEQQRIVKYLDEKCTEIDILHADIEKQIETLEEYKKSVITEAVTKGLNPDVEMKDSGIEWIGKTPNNWKTSKIKFHVNIKGRIGFRGYTEQDLVEEGEGAITLSPSNFNNMKMDYSHCTYISWLKYDESPEIMIKNGDTLFVKTGSSYGKACFVEKLPMEATINPQLIVFKNINIDEKLFSYIMQANFVKYQSELAVVGGTIPTMSQNKIGNFSILIPTENEQSEIVKYLDCKCSEIDGVISAKREQLETLEQYKKSLIYEYVTGKKEVPDNE